MERSNVVVFGYDELLLTSIEFISQTQTRISAVVFPSNRTDWRANQIRRAVTEKGFPILEQPPSRNPSEFTEKLRRIKPDLIYAWSYPMILPPEVINIPKYGCINVHMGLLPEYRGVNGVRWALLNGEEKTGITIHFMNSGIDTGDIISKVSFPITPEDDMLSLMKKSRSAGLHLLKHSWLQIASGTAEAVPQDESKARYYSAKMSAFETIDWAQSNTKIHNLIRASVSPFPGVYTIGNGHKIVMRKSTPVKNCSKSSTVGNIERMDDKCIEITTGCGNLIITEFEFEGNIIPAAQLYDLGLRIGGWLQNS